MTFPTQCSRSLLWNKSAIISVNFRYLLVGRLFWRVWREKTEIYKLGGLSLWRGLVKLNEQHYQMGEIVCICLSDVQYPVPVHEVFMTIARIQGERPTNCIPQGESVAFIIRSAPLQTPPRTRPRPSPPSCLSFSKGVQIVVALQMWWTSCQQEKWCRLNSPPRPGRYYNWPYSFRKWQ